MLRAFSRLALLAVIWLALLPAPAPAAEGIEVRNAALVAADDGYYLEATFELALTSALEDALNKGVPLHFLVEFELIRPRWYWLNEKVTNHQQRYRLSYNALTRQYRVASGLLAQTFDGLDEVERFLSRVTSRQIARVDELAKGTRYEAAIRLRLDTNQLPKPFQLSALGSREWSLQSDWHRWSFTA